MVTFGEDHGGAVGPLSRHAAARVLIVDDNPTNVSLLARVLRRAGLQHLSAVSDPRVAVERCLEVDADLVLLDLQMPHMDGFEVLAAFQAALPVDAFLPVVMLTGEVSTGARDRALAAGATDFLTKPFDVVEVVLRVRNLLQTRSLYTGMQQHTRTLQAHLDALEENERRQAAQRQAVTERVESVLDGAIQMVFQPIVDLCDGRILGVEALARFDAEPRRPPNEWFDEAATVGHGNRLEVAAAQAALGRFPELPDDTFLSINLSPSVPLEPAFSDLLDGVPADRLVLELTEHAPVDDYEQLLDCLGELRGRGVRIAVDDAGAGFAGLQHVLRLQPDILKLDIGLTRGIDGDPARRALSTALVTFAEEIEAVIVAEGIETPDELDTLRSLRVPWGQGYHLARPGALPLHTTHVAAAAS